MVWYGTSSNSSTESQSPPRDRRVWLRSLVCVVLMDSLQPYLSAQVKLSTPLCSVLIPSSRMRQSLTPSTAPDTASFTIVRLSQAGQNAMLRSPFTLVPIPTYTIPCSSHITTVPLTSPNLLISNLLESV